MLRESPWIISRREDLIWFHGASNGELTSARAVLETLLGRAPDLRLLVTTNTVSARRMVMQFGMSAAIGAIDYGGERQNPFGLGGQTMRDIPVSEATARLLDEELKRILEAAHGRARDTLDRNDALLHRMAA